MVTTLVKSIIIKFNSSNVRWSKHTYVCVGKIQVNQTSRAIEYSRTVIDFSNDSQTSIYVRVGKIQVNPHQVGIHVKLKQH